jgi:hypothetical protein
MLRRKSVWSVYDLKVYFEKFLIYKRDFKRISDFIPMKQTKDCIDLWYMVKKPLKLKEIEKDLQALVGNKVLWIAMKINQLMETMRLEELDQLSYFSLDNIAKILGKK